MKITINIYKKKNLSIFLHIFILCFQILKFFIDVIIIHLQNKSNMFNKYYVQTIPCTKQISDMINDIKELITQPKEVTTKWRKKQSQREWTNEFICRRNNWDIFKFLVRVNAHNWLTNFSSIIIHNPSSFTTFPNFQSMHIS